MAETIRRRIDIASYLPLALEADVPGPFDESRKVDLRLLYARDETVPRRIINRRSSKVALVTHAEETKNACLRPTKPYG